MHKVKTHRSGELFVKNHIKNMVIRYFYMVIIEMDEVKKILGKTTISDHHQKYTYLFPFHAKRARVRVRVVVRFGSLSKFCNKFLERLE